MKIDCEVIRDLLPLYVEKMVSNKSKEAVEEHLGECEDCRKCYQNMVAPELQTEFHKEEAQSFHKFVKKEKRHLGWKVAIATVIVVMSAVLIRLAMIGGIMTFLTFDIISSRVHEHTDVAHYEEYMGENAKEEYRNKWGMDEGIFPKQITDQMEVKDYKMVYYNPWDAQYLSYLTVDYDESDYQVEIERLKNYQMEDYKGIYGAEGFDEKYELLAMDSDQYHGFIYALTDGKKEIIYVEIIFCNYFMDINYEKYIDKEYLPIGFDATNNNPYRDEMMKKLKE